MSEDELRHAAGEGQVDLVRQLLAEGVTANAADDYNKTALDRAAQRGHLEVVKLLVEHRADVNACDYDDRSGYYVLHNAISGSMQVGDAAQWPIVSYLLEQRANLNASADNGETPFDGAGNLGVLQYFLDHGGKATPLALARSIDRGDLASARLLLEHGADVSGHFWVLNYRPKTSLEAAIYAANVEAVRLLLEHRAGVRASDEHHKGPLELAQERGNAEIVQLLTAALEASPE